MPLLKHGLKTSIAVLVAAAAAPLAAQAPAAQASIGVGTKVLDPKGGEVGTVTAVQAETVTVKTDKHEVGLPKASLAQSPNGLLIGLTRDQLNAEAEKASSAQAPQLAAGATVYDSQGGVVGTIEAVDAEGATIKLPNSTAKIPVRSFARGPKGPTIGETAASLEAKVAAAKSSSSN